MMGFKNSFSESMLVETAPGRGRDAGPSRFPGLLAHTNALPHLLKPLAPECCIVHGNGKGQGTRTVAHDKYGPGRVVFPFTWP